VKLSRMRLSISGSGFLMPPLRCADSISLMVRSAAKPRVQPCGRPVASLRGASATKQSRRELRAERFWIASPGLAMTACAPILRDARSRALLRMRRLNTTARRYFKMEDVGRLLTDNRASLPDNLVNEADVWNARLNSSLKKVLSCRSGAVRRPERVELPFKQPFPDGLPRPNG
jgi:hypothetical protein